ncbi:MAG: hypothetical protein PHS86_07830 [Syntrophaceae bacterium]|nr:hypothetical protein [Syntrophaceae bacterium]
MTRYSELEVARVSFFRVLLAICTLVFSGFTLSHASGGITPEQIFQANLDWQTVIGSWERLPEENPLAEKPNNSKEPVFRTLMTLRKDGTFRMFSETYPVGVDGVWSYDDHKIFVTLPDKSRIDMYVYGVKGDFMITRTPGKNGLDQLWSRVK